MWCPVIGPRVTLWVACIVQSLAQSAHMPRVEPISCHLSPCHHPYIHVSCFQWPTSHPYSHVSCCHWPSWIVLPHHTSHPYSTTCQTFTGPNQLWKCQIDYHVARPSVSRCLVDVICHMSCWHQQYRLLTLTLTFSKLTWTSDRDNFAIQSPFSEKKIYYQNRHDDPYTMALVSSKSENF